MRIYVIRPIKSMRHTSKTVVRAQHFELGKIIWESLACQQRLMLWW